MNWRFCHELAHILLGHQFSGLISSDMEIEADAMAGEIMLPADSFRKNMQAMNIVELKEQYAHASWEAVLRKWIEQKGAVLTIFDNGKITQRIAPEDFNFPRTPSRQELSVFRICAKEKRHYSQIFEDSIQLNVEGYYVDDGRGIKRVLLVTVID